MTTVRVWRLGNGFKRDTARMSLGLISKMALQGAYFVLAARFLEVRDFGIFSSVVAIAAILTPLVSIGFSQLAIRNISQGLSSPANQLSTGALITVLSASTFAIVIISLRMLITPDGTTVLTLIAILAADLYLIRIAEIVSAVFLGAGLTSEAARNQVTIHGIRLAAAAATYLGALPSDLQTWTLSYLGATTVGLMLVCVRAVRAFSLTIPDLRSYRKDFKFSLLLALGQASQTIYNDVDKAMLGVLSTPQSAGIYTAAYRLVDISLAPMRGIIMAANPRFFKRGVSGFGSSLAFARKLAKPAVAISGAASLVLLAGAPLLTTVLGSSFRESVPALQALSCLPVLKAGQYLLADALTAAGLQGRRAIIQFVVAVLNVAGNLLILPAYSWQGAVAVSIGCDFLLLSCLSVCAWLAYRAVPSPNSANLPSSLDPEEEVS